MKAFIAYRHTGEKTTDVKSLLTTVREALIKTGVEAYATYFDEKEFLDKALSSRAVMEHAFSIIDNSDFLFVVQTSENKSEGMLMEIGYCIAKRIPIIVATKKGIRNTYLPKMGNAKISWADLEDLNRKIQAIGFNKFVKQATATINL